MVKTKVNNLTLNRTKTQEILFHSPRRPIPHSLYPSPLPNITTVQTLKCLGVIISADLSIGEHISAIISTCQQSTYAIRILRSHGLQGDALHMIFKATTLAKLLYASPSWWGFATGQHKDRLVAVLRKAKKADFLPKDFPDITELCEMADARYFKAVTSNPGHVLNHLLPEVKATSMTLRKRSHSFVLPEKSTKLDESNFICRMLYRDVY